ncbi:MAG: cysteine hydrolase [Firmicutes bacterium]|nr:cysteine hydrolase [Bacillota bacterium]
MQVLVVVDMQNEFIDGALGTAEAVAIVPRVAEYIAAFDGVVYYTRDTHQVDYLQTQEGRNLPVEHCIEGTDGWQISAALPVAADAPIIDKPTFGSTELAAQLAQLHAKQPIDGITLIGLCTDICVISNAMLIKAQLPEVPVQVVADCCAGVTPASHANALEAMKMCQIKVI